MFCARCGAPIPEGAKFCGDCGAIVVPESKGFVHGKRGKQKSKTGIAIGGVAAAAIIAVLISFGGEKGEGTHAEEELIENVIVRAEDTISAEDSIWAEDTIPAEEQFGRLSSVAEQELPKVETEALSNHTDTESLGYEAPEAIAARLSTDESAFATEFDWFMDYVVNGGYENGRVITDATLSTRVTDQYPALNGGWKAFMFNEEGVYGSDLQRYFNANVQVRGGSFNITMNWKYLFNPAEGSSEEEPGSDSFSGTYDDSAGTATAESSYAKVVFDAFYLSSDG